MISSDRFPTSGYGKGRLNGFGKDWHLAGKGIPGSENLPGVGSVTRTGPNGIGAEYVMTQRTGTGEHHEVKGDIPNSPYRLAG
jgi:hypothetical protein